MSKQLCLGHFILLLKHIPVKGSSSSLFFFSMYTYTINRHGMTRSALVPSSVCMRKSRSRIDRQSNAFIPFG